MNASTSGRPARCHRERWATQNGWWPWAHKVQNGSRHTGRSPPHPGGSGTLVAQLVGSGLPARSQRS
jgi:hypothetical protein